MAHYHHLQLCSCLSLPQVDLGRNPTHLQPRGTPSEAPNNQRYAKIKFLVACTQLYKMLCQSVGRSVGYIYFQSRILLFQGLQRLITAPAEPHMTKKAVCTALFKYMASMRHTWLSITTYNPILVSAYLSWT